MGTITTMGTITPLTITLPIITPLIVTLPIITPLTITLPTTTLPIITPPIIITQVTIMGAGAPPSPGETTMVISMATVEGKVFVNIFNISDYFLGKLGHISILTMSIQYQYNM